MKSYILKSLILLAMILIMNGCVIKTEEASVDEIADTVLTNGKIYTVNKEKKWAEAVAIKNGTIIYVGLMEKIDTYIGKKTEVIDLEGKFAMPSFVDSHMHPAANAYSTLFTASLADVYSHEEYIAKIREFAEANPDKTGIMGSGFERSLYDTIGPRKEWLDEIDSTRPIAIISGDIHSMWVNSKTLEMLGITKDTPDPAGGVIQRDPITGEPTGLLQEYAAFNPAWELMPLPTLEEYKTSLLWLQKWLNAKGITTVHDAWGEADNPDYYEAYSELAEEGKLTVRYRASTYIDPDLDYMSEIENGIKLAKIYNHPHFKAQSFKFLTDSVLEEETALLIEPYTHRPDYYGSKLWTDEDLEAAFVKVDKAGYQIHVHVIGDGATKYTVDTFGKVQETNGLRDSRHSLAHIQLARPEEVIKMSELGIIAHMSPYWMITDEHYDKFYLPYLGEERANNTYPHKSLFNTGVKVTLASDWPTSEPNPIIGLYNGMKRSSVGGAQLAPASECVTLEEMLSAGTINGAYANFLENEVGSIEVGKKADIIVLSKNLFEIDPEKIPNVEVKMTFFEGKKVY
jgi:predicted amidohydrolase YtcJ